MADALDLEQDLEALEGRDDGAGDGAGHAAGAEGGDYRLGEEVPELFRSIAGGVLGLDGIFGSLERGRGAFSSACCFILAGYWTREFGGASASGEPVRRPCRGTQKAIYVQSPY